ncbi:MMPL family transporter [Methylosarcina fibrata]|uniref:MMPL family transporter n=1 Tax=Methylosarcina fibrata TaxID=105972 RepID=UPI000381717F|nr:MMPL family transporter [Methylosarcina fibrata]
MSLKFNLRSFLVRSGKWALYHPMTVLLTVCLLAALTIEYTANNLSINTDTAELIAPDAPFQQNRRKFEKAFSKDMHTLLLVVESSAPELTRSATKRLGRLLNADQTHFDSVYIPNENQFFHKNGLLYLDVEDLQKLSANLSQAQPFIGRISQEPNLTGFFSILQDALDSANKDQTVPIDLTSLINKVTHALHKRINGENSLLSWEALINEQKPTSASATKGFIYVLPKFDYSSIRPAEEAINAIRKAAAEIQEPDLPAVKVWITGEVGLEDDELSGMSTGTFNASIFSVVLVCAILLTAYRSVMFTVATLITLALGMIFCAAFAAVSVKELNLISVAFAVSNIGLGVEYAIHFCLRYRDNLTHHIVRERAIRSTLISTSPSLLLCAGTTAIGLYAFIPTDYRGVSELGLLAGTSLFICLFITLTVLPVLLKLVPVSGKREPVAVHSVLTTLSEKLAGLTLHYARPITIATFILAVVSLLMVFKVKTDFNPINLRDPNTESVIAFKNLMKDKDTSPMTLTVMADNEQKAREIQQKLEKVDTVDKTVSLFDFLPGEQETKLAMIEEMALMLGTQVDRFPNLKPDPDPVPAIKSLIQTIDGVLPNKTDNKEIAALNAFKKELKDILIELDARQEPSRREFIEDIQTTLLGTLPKVMNELYASFDAHEVSLDDLPEDIKVRWLSKEGLYRIQVIPKYDLNDLGNLQRFITDVQAVAPETTDLPVMYWESMKEVITAFQEAIAIALVIIALLLFAIRRNITDTLLVMTPLILAGLFTMASTVLTGTAINFANIIALPLLLGLGVDNGIHMVEKLRHSVSEEQNIYRSSTARAMFYGALTTASSFSGLAFSPHQGIASMGLVITIGIFWIMTCTFIILPALSKIVIKHERAA